MKPGHGVFQRTMKSSLSQKGDGSTDLQETISPTIMSAF